MPPRNQDEYLRWLDGLAPAQRFAVHEAAHYHSAVQARSQLYLVQRHDESISDKDAQIEAMKTLIQLVLNSYADVTRT